MGDQHEAGDRESLAEGHHLRRPHHALQREGDDHVATGGKNTRTTQVFVNTGENAYLDGYGLSPFGTVTSGLSVFSTLYHGKQSAEAYRNQAALTNYGGRWVRKHYPKLDWIKTARLVHSG